MAFYQCLGVSGGGGGSGTAYGGTSVPSASLGNNGDYYYQWDESGDVQITYVKLDNTWHKIAGGDVGDFTCNDYGRYTIVNEGIIAKEGTINE